MRYANRHNKNAFGSLGMFHHLLNDFFDVAQESEKVIEKLPSFIRANVSEKDDKFMINLELPGIDKKSVNLEIEDRVLIVSVNKPKDENSDQFVRREFNYGEAKRRFKLSNAVDTSNIEAEMNHGILQITLAKKPAFVPKDIKIK